VSAARKEGVQPGDVRSLARAITLVEQRDPAAFEVLESAARDARPVRVVGLTGAPGTGKSTLVDALIGVLRAKGESVAVLAVDPNSVFSGGALLGDRIRMQRHTLDPGVYIRSMGARGHLGGLSRASREVIRLLAAYGFDWVILETVGVGQSELEVADVADTTIVVLTPGLGDGVQMLKAGIMEIANVFVVNKADQPGSQRTMQEVRSMLSSGPKLDWRPPIVATVASLPKGIDEVLAAIDAHQQHMEASGEAGSRTASRLKNEVADLVGELARSEAMRLLESDQALERRLLSEGNPYAVADEIRARLEVPVQPRTPRSQAR
jgi:LAO/AO transport system kinase